MTTDNERNQIERIKFINSVKTKQKKIAQTDMVCRFARSLAVVVAMKQI